MGRKRKTRWRRLSIGEISANEEEEMDGLAGGIQMSLKLTDDQGDDNNVCLVGGKMVNGKLGDQNHHIRPSSGSSPSTMTTPTNNTSSTASSVDSQPTGNHHHHNNHHHYNNSSNHQPSSSHYNPRYSNHHGNYHQQQQQQQPHHHHHHYTQSNQHYASSGKSSESNYHNGHYSNYYQGGRNNYNNYRNNPHHYSSHNGGGGGGGAGGGAPNSTSTNATTTTPGNNGETSSNSSTTNPPTQTTSTTSNGSGSTGGGNYHYTSRSYGGGGGRFRKPRPYGSYYYQNGGQAGQGQNGEGPNRPSYNQDEYTKITTPRQDVLFKKGYLSQRKSQSVESNSATTTPSASTNGTPDTQSTNGVHSDYSEGYENGETDCGVPYDDTVYYNQSDTAVFTDPHTGQVFYGHCSPAGEYFDAYPVMVAGYPAPVYYHMPYQPMDWNGMPAPMYPVLAAPVPMEEHLLPQNYKGVEPMEVTPASTTGGGNPTVNSVAAESGKTEPDGVGATTTSKDPNNSQNPTAPVTSTDEANNGSSNSATTTTAHSDTTTTSVPAVLPPPPIAHPAAIPHMGMPPPPGGHPLHLQPHHPHHAHHIPPGVGCPGSGYVPTAASSHHGTNHGMPALHPQHHLNSVPGPFIYPHPAGFVYGPPIFHGVVHVPFGGGAVSSLEISSSNSRKKRKKKRRKKDGQLTDEGSDETASTSNPDEDPQAVEYEERESESLPEEQELYPENSINSSFMSVMGEEENKQMATHVSSSLSSSSASLSIDKEDSMNENSSENSDETLVAKNILKQTITPPLSPPKNSKQDSTANSANANCANADDETPPDESTTEILIVRSDSESDRTIEENSQIESIPKTTTAADDEDKKEDDDEKEEEESPPTATTNDDDNVVEPNPVPDNVEATATTAAAAAPSTSLDCNNPETDKNSSPPENETPTTETPLIQASNTTVQDPPAAVPVIDTPVITDNDETIPDPPEPPQVEEEELTDDIIALINATTTSNKRSMNKPVDLTVMLPPTVDSNDLHLLQLQRSPDGFANEPSSPDSFNTNQSVAGSEVAVGDTLSFSETDPLNRTTSIDEVEEDLPHESYYGSYDACCLNSIALPNSSSIQFVSVDSSPVITSATALAEEFSASDQSSSLPLDNDPELLSELLLEPEEEPTFSLKDSQDPSANAVNDNPTPNNVITDNVTSDNVTPANATSDNTTTTNSAEIQDEETKQAADEAELSAIPDEKDLGNHVTEDLQPFEPVVDSQKEPEQKTELSTDDQAHITTSPPPPSTECENSSGSQIEPQQTEQVTTPVSAETSVSELTSPVSELTEPVLERRTVVPELKTPVPELTTTVPEATTPVEEVTALVPDEVTTPVPEEVPPERPKSITLAVSEWLKTQGDDALTPVISSDDNELTQEEEEEEEEGDGDDEDEEDDGGGGDEKSRRSSDNAAVGGGAPNQKNVHGNPWAVPSNKSVTGKRSRLLLTSRRVYQVSGFKGYRVLQSKKTNKSQDTASLDGNDPRVAPSSTSSATTSADSTATKPTTLASKPPNAPTTASSNKPTNNNKPDKTSNNQPKDTKKGKNQKLHNYDSGLELSSPENGDKKLDQSAEVLTPPELLNQNNEPSATVELSPQIKDTPNAYLLTSCETSPSRHTPASIPEELSEEIYNPRNFSKYYQFGVVFDDDASSIKTADLNDLDPISLDLDDPPTAPSPNDDLSICSNEDDDDITPSYYNSLKPTSTKNKIKVDGQSLFSMLPGNKNTTTIATTTTSTTTIDNPTATSCKNNVSTCEGIEMKNDLKNNVITSATTKGIDKELSSCDANKIDLEIGAAFLESSTTLQTKNINQHGTTSNQIASADQPSTSLGTPPLTPATRIDPKHFHENNLMKNNDGAQQDIPPLAKGGRKSSTLYINPMSLAVEMDFDGNNQDTTTANDPNTDEGTKNKNHKIQSSDDDEEIPEYVSPEIDYPVFNHIQGTAPAKLIRNRLESVTGGTSGGQNIPCAICCVVQ